MSIVHVNDSNFEAEVMKADCTVLIDLFAEWCGPCKMRAPVLEEIANEHPEYKICKVDVDESPSIAMGFRASSIPMLVVIKNGKVTNQAIGFMSKAKVLALLD